jgi:hypothetical protein
VSKSIIAGAIVLAAVIAGAVYLTHDAADQSLATIPSSPDNQARAERATPGAQDNSVSPGHTASQPGRMEQPGRTDSKSVPPDPRLAALGVSPDNGLIEFVVASDGKVIAEIDKDPTSLGFRKPLREYTYSGDEVIGLTSYRYYGDHVEIARTAVSYKPDGSVDKYSESTRLDYGEKKK